MDQNVDWFNLDSSPAITKTRSSTNCPNCGAPINAERCPYCGSLFIDFACMDADKPFFMKIKKGEDVFVVKVTLKSMSFHRDDPVIAYVDNRRYTTYISEPEVTVDFVIVP